MKDFTKRDIEYHPVLLQESKNHYDTNGQNNIIDFECTTTIAGGFGAIDYNIIKYKNRRKGQDELDSKKIATFEAWRELLRDLLELGYGMDTHLRYAMQAEYPNMKYSLKD